ncbi:MAG: hypothetical protein RL033_2327, partial [Pseudomonadota bacterium]
YEPEPGWLSDGWAKLCCAALLAALVRTLLAAPRGGYAVTLALAFAALVFAGKARNPLYAGYVVPFLLSGVWALGESKRRASSPFQARRLWLGAGVQALAAVLALSAVFGIVQLRAWAQGRQRVTSSAVRASVGFSERMDLGALDGLLDSERRMLRVRGARVDYLRGLVFDRYEAGSWLASDDDAQSVPARFDAVAAPPSVEIEAISDKIYRSFIPLEARQLQTTPTEVLLDRWGVMSLASKRQLSSVRFVPGPRDRAPVSVPHWADLHLPRRVKARLSALAVEWTAGAQTPADKLEALSRRLSTDFSYARAFERPAGMDPVLAFLFHDRRGHCEYFASALALLGRAAGIPTRLVMGYRVSERSPFGYYVVRERNAHAWVEAWLPGEGWVTRDATPAEAQPNNDEHEASYVESSVDALRVGYAGAIDWLEHRTLEQTGLAWLIGCGVLAVIVARGIRRRARARALSADEALLPFMQPLIDVLDRTGHVRRPDEPLERLAARVPHAEAARLLRRYSALRYGGVGDGEALARDVKVTAAELRRRA